MMANLLPYTIYICDLVCQQQLVTKSTHYPCDLYITASKEKFNSFFDVCFLLCEVIIELFDELLTLIKCFDMSLPSTISLIFNHNSTFLRLDHVQVKA